MYPNIKISEIFNTLIDITRNECDFLREYFKGRFNKPHIRTIGTHKPARQKSYVVEESSFVLRLLKEYNENTKQKGRS